MGPTIQDFPCLVIIIHFFMKTVLRTFIFWIKLVEIWLKNASQASKKNYTFFSDFFGSLLEGLPVKHVFCFVAL